MDDDRGRPLGDGREDLLDEVLLADVGEALVVDHDVKLVGPAGHVVDADLVLGGAAALVDDGPLDVGPGADALGDDLLLILVVVAATPGDEQGAERTVGLLLGGAASGANARATTKAARVFRSGFGEVEDTVFMIFSREDGGSWMSSTPTL